MYPFEFRFLQDIIAGYYTVMERGFKVFNYSAILSILVSCLGLFGLSSFIAEKRTKEIGIRKVHGASVWDVFVQLSYDFLKLILVSTFIASIISFYSINQMLGMIISTIEINYLALFFITLCMVLAIVVITVSYHTVKAALTDPVKALRYE
jgi:putative ABC transport system permease protein